MLIADVYINIQVKRIAQAFSYSVPDDLQFLTPGWRVIVPFARRKVEGFIVNISDCEPDSSLKLKAIDSTVDDEPWFTPKMFAQAMWLADYYLSSPAEAMRLFMPGKSGVKIKAIDSGSGQEYAVTKREVRQYKKQALLANDSTYDVRIKLKNKPAQQRLLLYLQNNGPTDFSVLKSAGFSLVVIKALAEAGLIIIEEKRIFRDSYQSVNGTHKNETLTKYQQIVCSQILASVTNNTNKTFLLHGVTGSGKTRVYIETVAKVRELGRQAIVLVPEIALTGQAVRTFKEYFADDVVVLHSQLSVSERNDAISRIRRGETGIAIGARSALFVPFNNIGAIIIDEEQDSSYKQEENPAYNARIVATAFAKIHSAVLILGSATPSMESYYQAQIGNYQLLELPERIDNKKLPNVEIVDMREELRHGNRQIISLHLRHLITDTIKKNEQLIIMLNRRGYSTFIMCRSCGYVITCKQCGMPLVYHLNGRLTCHHCDLPESVPDICPKCGSTYIKYFGSGTEKLEQELSQLVPEARIIRMDRDTTSRKDAHNKILDAFRHHEYDILLGTQMVAKGHDIPNVTGVGIISADSCLNIPYFRAAEQCFMLITQTAGRAGRGDVPGKVVVQSYNPEHYAVQTAQLQDYKSFYIKELKLRQLLNYPPFCRLVKLTVRHTDKETTQEICQEIVHSLKHSLSSERHQLIGPFPAMVAKWKDFYRFCILIKTTDLTALQNYLRTKKYNLRTDLMIDIDPISTN